MGRKRMPGLVKVGEIWQIDKRFRGRRICESTGERDLERAQEYLIRRLEEARQASVFGVRPARSFRQAATRFLTENHRLRSIGQYAWALKQLDPYVGELPIASVHMGSLRPFIEARQREGRKAKTINIALAAARRILNVAASEWIDEHNLTWLAAVPKIMLLRVDDAAEPYPLSWEEQGALLRELPPHLARMALFKVNTGCRNREVCGLRWEWEVPVPELDTVVFIVPGKNVKNGEDRLIVLNRVARSVIEGVRGMSPEHVFVYRGRPIGTMHNSAWQSARQRAGLSHVRVHDLKHTFGRRLRAAGVSFEDRQDLLGHRSGRITTHYSAAELENLLEAAYRVCGEGARKSPELVLLKKRTPTPLMRVSA